MKYVPESYSHSPVTTESSSPDDYDTTNDGEPVESRPSLMFLDTQPTMDSEQDEQNDDNPPTDADDGQMVESVHSTSDKAA